MLYILLLYICLFIFNMNLIACSTKKDEEEFIFPEYKRDEGSEIDLTKHNLDKGKYDNLWDTAGAAKNSLSVINDFSNLLNTYKPRKRKKVKFEDIIARQIILEDIKKDDSASTKTTIGWTCSYLEKITDLFDDDGISIPISGFNDNKCYGVFMGDYGSAKNVKLNGKIYNYVSDSKDKKNTCKSLPDLSKYDKKIRDFYPELSKKEGLVLTKKLHYLKSNDGKRLIPVFKVSGSYKIDNNDVKILDFFHPLKSSYMPTFNVKNQDNYNTQPNIKEKIVNSNNSDDRGTGSTSNNETLKKQYLEFSVNLDITDFDSKNNDLQISNFSSSKNDEKSYKFTMDKKYWTRNGENIKKDGLRLILTATNQNFGFTYSKIVTLILSAEIIDFIVKKMRDISEITGDDPYHNFGLSWGEKDLGPTIVSRYLNEMNGKAIREYYWDGFTSWERDYLDNGEGGINGLDHDYTDNVDMAAYVGHGNGNGITFETTNNDTLVRYDDAGVVKGWGNLDCEYHAWQSCQVLANFWNGIPWWVRWGPVFNGLHLIHGFETNAGVGGHNLLKFFAENQYDHNKTMKRSWFDAALDDQDSGRVAAVMGVMIDDSEDSNGTKHNSISATTSGLRRAHWNDKINKRGQGVPESKIKGWWRASITV